MREPDVIDNLFERRPFWVGRAKVGGGYIIFKEMKVVATCGYPGRRGLEWCKDEIGRRIGVMAETSNKGG
jgi:hypothetical protein